MSARVHPSLRTVGGAMLVGVANGMLAFVIGWWVILTGIIAGALVGWVLCGWDIRDQERRWS